MKKPIATKTTLIGKSNTNPEYLKFKVELSTGEIIPAYGKTLQDALRRANKDYTITKLRKDIRQIYGMFVVLVSIILIVLASIILL